MPERGAGLLFLFSAGKFQVAAVGGWQMHLVEASPSVKEVLHLPS